MATIYESPDGGDKERKLIKKRYEDTWNEFTFEYDWDYMAEKHPAILEKLEELKVITRLCDENKS